MTLSRQQIRAALHEKSQSGRHQDVVSFARASWQQVQFYPECLEIVADSYLRLGNIAESIRVCLLAVSQDRVNRHANLILFLAMKDMNDNKSLYDIWLRAVGAGLSGEAAEELLVDTYYDDDKGYDLFAAMAVVALRQGRTTQAVTLFGCCLSAEPSRKPPQDPLDSSYATLAVTYDDGVYHRDTVEGFLDFVEAQGGLPTGTVVDAACGTGLAGERLRPRATRLIGLDLSPPMIERAAERGLYDDLICDDMCTGLANLPAPAHAVICIGATYYLDQLEHFLAGAAAALEPGGRLYFTDFPAPPGQGQMITRGGTWRYCRSRDYIQALAEQQGFSLGAMSMGPVFGLPCQYLQLLRN